MNQLSPSEAIERIETGGMEGRFYLEQLEVPGKIEILCDAFGQSSSYLVRTVICNIFASLRDPRALGCLLAALDDPIAGVCAAAADAVGNCAFDRNVSDPLRNALGEKLIRLAANGSTLGLRASSFYALGLMRCREATQLIIAALEDDSPMIRWCAAEALSYMATPATQWALEDRLKKETNERVLRYIRLALSQIAIAAIAAATVGSARVFF